MLERVGSRERVLGVSEILHDYFSLENVAPSHNLSLSASPPPSHHAFPFFCCPLFLTFCLLHSCLITVTRLLSPFLPSPSLLSVSVLCLELQSNEQVAAVWESVLALRGDNKPICYLPQWPLQRQTTANSQRPSQGQMFPMKAAPSKCWEAAHTPHHSAAVAVRRLYIREQRFVMKSHKYFPYISNKQFFFSLGRCIFSFSEGLHFDCTACACFWKKRLTWVCNTFKQSSNIKMIV